MKMNKRGDIPITILVIGVFAICGLALLSFFSSSFQIKNYVFVGFEEMEKINVEIEKYSNGESLENLQTIQEDGKVFLYQEKNISKGILFWKKEKTFFSVKYGLS